VQIIQRALADPVFKVPRDRVRVVAPDTGGGFGQKSGLYPESVLCLEASRQRTWPDLLLARPGRE
jgi:carbon-monoxide dehydrogenase large subunit